MVKQIAKKVLIFLILLILFSTIWSQIEYGNIKMEEIMFYLTTPLESTETGILISYLEMALIPTIIVFFFIINFINVIYKKINTNNYVLELKIFAKEFSIRLSRKITLIVVKLFFISLLFCILLGSLYVLEVHTYIHNQSANSKFIEQNYVDTRKVSLEFPEKKRNLIFIFVESLEATYFSKDFDNLKNVNLMPNLYNLSVEDNTINFSNNDRIGGATQVSCLSWTTAGMVSITSGIPLKVDPAITNVTSLKKLVPGDYTLGEILNKEGYKQMIMFGSDQKFGNRGNYFYNHGKYKVYDYLYAKEKKNIPEDYREWWGFEDSKLFKYAKEELINLSKDNKPFNFSLLTANTHHPQGYVEKNCEEKYESNYANSIVCSSDQIYDFVKWIQEQDFYDNTTVIISGDHLSMANDFFDEKNDENRTVYNLFINSAIKTDNNKNRKFTTMDLFPTTLASMGVKIEGDRLALGTNLFSNKKTLLETYGVNKVNNEFKINSKFYTNKILNNK